MNETMFWELIDRVHATSGGNMDTKCDLLEREISRLNAGQALAFAALFDAQMDRAYDWGLWGAAYVINGGCSDDTFTDFRSSLISRGRAAFESAVSNPDSLADEAFDEDAWFYEGYQYAVTEAVEAVIGEFPDRQQQHPAEPSGKEWAEDDVEALFPRLAGKFA